MALPLSDLRVVEMCQVYAGPYAAMILADMGADVVKLEPPEGDSSRQDSSVSLGVDGMSFPFLTFNRNKRSIALNVHGPRGKEVAYKLFQWADVFLIATRVATRGRWGLTYEDASAINPKLIYASITGFGENGPDADLPGIDLVNQARSGDAAFRGAPGGPPTSPTSLFHFDMATSMLTVASVLGALRQRDQTGLGQKLELSLLQSALSCHAVNMTRVKDSSAVNPTSRNPGVNRIYRCSDNRYIFASPIASRWPEFCHATGLERLLEDPLFNTPQKRQQNQQALSQVLSQQFATRSAGEWEARLKAADQYVTVVQDMSTVHDDPQVIANQMIVSFQQPGVGAVEAVNLPFKMSGMASDQWFRRPAPALGEHTGEVLHGLGYTSEGIDLLKADGTVA